MKIFVVIVTYKGKQWYDKCFGSLRESTIPVQTIAVDNSPNEEDAEYIRSHFPEVHLIKTSENLGFGRANNLGMRYALDSGCDYVFLLNQDAWIMPDTLSIMLPIAEKDKNSGIFSPMHLYADERSLSIEIEDRGTNYANSLLADCYCNRLQDIYYFHYVNAAAWLIPRSTLKTVGGFDPMFFLYGEDDNYLHRVEYFGKWVGLIPRARIIHDHQKGGLQDDPIYHEKQIQLVQYLNILQSFRMYKTMFFYMRKFFLYATIMYDRRKKLLYEREIIFLWENRNAIKNSRKQNMIRGETWL